MKRFYYTLCIVLFLIFFIWDRLVGEATFFLNFLFLTIISYFITWTYFIHSFLIELGIAKEHKLEKYFNFTFSLSFTVCIMFWLMYLDDKNSVLPEGFEIPLLLNIFLHGGTFILCFVEQILTNPRRTNNHIHFLIYPIFSLIYLIFIVLIYRLTEYAVYPFLKKATYLELLIIYVEVVIICLIGHFIYKFLSREIGDKKKLMEEVELRN